MLCGVLTLYRAKEDRIPIDQYCLRAAEQRGCQREYAEMWSSGKHFKVLVDKFRRIGRDSYGDQKERNMMHKAKTWLQSRDTKLAFIAGDEMCREEAQKNASGNPEKKANRPVSVGSIRIVLTAEGSFRNDEEQLLSELKQYYVHCTDQQLSPVGALWRFRTVNIELSSEIFKRVGRFVDPRKSRVLGSVTTSSKATARGEEVNKHAPSDLVAVEDAGTTRTHTASDPPQEHTTYTVDFNAISVGNRIPSKAHLPKVCPHDTGWELSAGFADSKFDIVVGGFILASQHTTHNGRRRLYGTKFEDDPQKRSPPATQASVSTPTTTRTEPYARCVYSRPMADWLSKEFDGWRVYSHSSVVDAAAFSHGLTRH
ncbi:hypothetical protein FISHEDRAFT_60387 [Fistulina hepatica ATCC 64428]|uniref:Uncharacterized protein n=1 Tax=Fistulina hepatica ATCC 64428 TaxID=1128425 RepID=A0A0D7A6I5_9AGAR|nr:hypothetical protein FISHEDRAFT_60387 [Fistulina hepatica ATCC 64428]